MAPAVKGNYITLTKKEYNEALDSLCYARDNNIREIRVRLMKDPANKIESMRLHVNEYYRSNNMPDIDYSNTDLISKKELMHMIEQGIPITKEVVRDMYTISL